MRISVLTALICQACTPQGQSSLSEQSKQYAGEKRSVALRFQKKPLKLPISLEFPQAVWVSSDSPTNLKIKVVNLGREKIPLFLLKFSEAQGSKISDNIKGFESPLEIQFEDGASSLEKTIVLQLTDEYNFAEDYVRIVPEVEVVQMSSKSIETEKKQ